MSRRDLILVLGVCAVFLGLIGLGVGVVVWQQLHYATGNETRLDPIRAMELYQRGRGLARTGDLQGALREYTRAIAMNPADPRIWTERGGLHTQLRRYPDAVDDLNEALRLNPNSDSLVWGGLAWANWGLGDYETAATAAAKAAQLNPRNMYTHFTAGAAYYYLDDFDTAKQHLQTAIQTGHAQQEYVQMYLWLARVQLGERQAADEALRSFLDASTSTPTQSFDPNWAHLIINYLLGDATEEELFAQAERIGGRLSVNEKRCEALFYAGSVHVFNDETEQAQQMFRDSLLTNQTRYYEFHGSMAALRRLGVEVE